MLRLPTGQGDAEAGAVRRALEVPAVRRKEAVGRPVERRAAMPAGFKAGGLAAGIKASGRPDLAVIVTIHGPAAAAAVFTPNAFAAAPVRLLSRVQVLLRHFYEKIHGTPGALGRVCR